jgi:hypothetical protein
MQTKAIISYLYCANNCANFGIRFNPDARLTALQHESLRKYQPRYQAKEKR